MNARSMRGVALGAVVALGMPVAAIVLSWLVQAGIAPYDAVREQFGTLSALLWFALGVLGPVGIVIVAWAAGTRSLLAWLAAFIVGVPIVLVVWFVGAATLSGTMGNPF